MPRTLPSHVGLDEAVDTTDVGIPLSIDDLEAGVRVLDGEDINRREFWQLNNAAFRRTLLVAIEETSEALSSQQIPVAWRKELESQLKLLRHYVGSTDCGVLGRA